MIRYYKLILCIDKSRIKDGFSHADLVTGELYDLNKDPQEWNNIFYDEKYKAIRQNMSGKLIKHLEKYVKSHRRADSARALASVTDKFGIDSLSLPTTNYKDGFETPQGNPYHGYVHAGFNFVGKFCFRDFTSMRIPDFWLHTAP